MSTKGKCHSCGKPLEEPTEPFKYHMILEDDAGCCHTMESLSWDMAMADAAEWMDEVIWHEDRTEPHNIEYTVYRLPKHSCALLGDDNSVSWDILLDCESRDAIHVEEPLAPNIPKEYQKQ